jgi:hypothetical protein
MTVTINLNGNLVASSKNLRGILDYARKVPVHRVAIYRNLNGDGLLCVTFDNGANCQTTFASYTVCIDWVKSRRSWGLTCLSNGTDQAVFKAL